VGKVPIGTPLLFDIGVYLVVVGICCKIILVLAESTQGLGGLAPQERERYSSPLEQPIEDPRSEEGGEGRAH